jgi:hypothetical protein
MPPLGLAGYCSGFVAQPSPVFTSVFKNCELPAILILCVNRDITYCTNDMIQP